MLHGGAITALLDNAAGFVARPRDPAFDGIGLATLDLRIDYTGPAKPGHAVIARAECFKRTSKVAFVRAEAFTEAPYDLVATFTGTFMYGTPTGPRTGGPPP